MIEITFQIHRIEVYFCFFMTSRLTANGVLQNAWFILQTLYNTIQSSNTNLAFRLTVAWSYWSSRTEFNGIGRLTSHTWTWVYRLNKMLQLVSSSHSLWWMHSRWLQSLANQWRCGSLAFLSTLPTTTMVPISQSPQMRLGWHWQQAAVRWLAFQHLVINPHSGIVRIGCIGSHAIEAEGHALPFEICPG